MRSSAVPPASHRIDFDLSFRLIEAPCLRWRRRCVVERVAMAPVAYTYE
jgi:hypothetical protein